jgi:hypothetical protein
VTRDELQKSLGLEPSLFAELLRAVEVEVVDC